MRNNQQLKEYLNHTHTHHPSALNNKTKSVVLKVWNVHFSFNIRTQTVPNIYFPSNASVHSSIEHRPLVFLCLCLTLIADSTLFSALSHCFYARPIHQMRTDECWENRPAFTKVTTCQRRTMLGFLINVCITYLKQWLTLVVKILMQSDWSGWFDQCLH